MIEFERYQLDNGLKILIHGDQDTEVATVNILYDVGSKDENINKTGFAHLFEHLMFGGSKNIHSYDEPLQKAGGENNAFTSPDITNYYLTLPAANLETGFWLESDRMLEISFDPKVLEVQKNVVIEEFKQRYLNQPYGDIWLKIRPMAYKAHPYMWPTIGKDISHIEGATMDDVKEFFFNYYSPNNAIMVVAGKVEKNQVLDLAQKWFGSIPYRERPERNLSVEPEQKRKRILEVEADVPMSALYKAYHMTGRTGDHYHEQDLCSDILGRGKSSRLYQKLVKEENIFNSINAYVTGSVDPGLLVISGKVNPGIEIEEAEKKVDEVIEEFKTRTVDDNELQKVKNQAESSLVFSEVEVLNRAMNLAYYESMGDADEINREAEKIQAVTPEKIQEAANKVLDLHNCNTLYYKSNSDT